MHKSRLNQPNVYVNPQSSAWSACYLTVEWNAEESEKTSRLLKKTVGKSELIPRLRAEPPSGGQARPLLLKEKGRIERSFEKSLSSQERPARLGEFSEAGGDLG